MDEETAGKIRGSIRRVTIKNLNDDGPTQTASVETADGLWRSDVEVLQPYGMATSVPEDGALGVVLAIGGDEGDLVMLPVSNPSKRMGGLKSGDVGLYTKDGDQIILRSSGDLEITIGAKAVISVPGGMEITTPHAKFIADMLECTGDIKDKNGTMQEMRDQYNAHAHPTGPQPNPQMD